MPIQLKITKAGDAQKIQLNMTKSATFFVEMLWKSQTDPDAHALLLSGGKVLDGDLKYVLSTYNTRKNNPQQGVIELNPDKSFNLPDRSLHHSGDVETGKPEGVAEMITVDTGSVNKNVDEIAIFVTIHKPKGATLRQVGDCTMRIRDDDGKILAEAVLSSEFADFNAVLMGSFLRESDGSWSYSSAGQGIKGDFATVLTNFS